MADIEQNGHIKPDPEQDPAKGYNPTGDELKVYDQWKRRKSQLMSSRTNIYQLNIDTEMRRFDRMYFRRTADIPTSELDPNQRPIAINNAYGKIQTALSILVDRNPKLVLNEKNPKYSANRELIRSLADHSFINTNSLGQIKLSIFNQAKRGWMVGRTFNRRLIHEARFPKSMDDKGKIIYETKMVKKLDDVAYLNFSNYNTWIDEQARPEDFYAARDWMWREVWFIDDLKRTFPEKDFPNMKFVSEGGDTRENVMGTYVQQDGFTGNTPQAQKPGMVEIFFYENQYEDKFIMEAHGVMVLWEPMPQNNKRLSCVYAPWHLRSDDTIYGIGVIEEMERDEELADRILNMNMRQLLLTIAPMGFYTGTEDFEDENIKITPGVLRRVMDTKSIVWQQIPQGNPNAIETLDWIADKQDQKTGITKTIMGDDEKGDQTAFEIGVQRETGLKRLRLPLKNLQYALEWEFNNRISLIQQVYSDFDVEHIASQEQINAYLDEVGNDPAFYFIENEGKVGQEKFYAKRYPEVQLPLEKDPKGNFIESDSKQFFKIKPSMLAYEGFVTVDVNSLLVASEEMEKADTMRMANIIIPLLQQPKEIVAKPIKQILTAFNKDPKLWLPDDWVDFINGKKDPANDALPGGAGAPAVGADPMAGGVPKPTTVVPPASIAGNAAPNRGVFNQ